MPWRLPIAAIQMTAVADLAANLAVVRQLVGEAATAGARLVVLPECFPFLGDRERDKMEVAEDLDADSPGPIRRTLAELAIQHQLWIIGGGMPERIPGDLERAYNTAVVIDPRGELRARYRKIHLFDVAIPGGAVLLESAATAAGDAAVVVEIDGARVGLTICYDVRFPELFRELVLDHGAQVLVVPAAFTAHTGRAHWHLLLRSRAIENQAWIVAAAQVGHHNAKRESFGHSMIIDPWGDIVAEQASGPGVISAVLDGETVTTRRRQMPCLDHVVRWPTAASTTDDDVPRLPRGKGLALSRGQLMRIGMTLVTLVAMVALQRPCSDAVGRFVTGFGSAQAPGVPEAAPQVAPSAAAPAPAAEAAYERLTPSMTDAELRAAIERAKRRAAASTSSSAPPATGAAQVDPMAAPGSSTPPTSDARAKER